jgi:hypothetical protein
MQDFEKIREAVDRVVSQVVEARMAELRNDVIARVSAELEPALKVAPGGSPTDLLNAAVGAVQEAATQADILRALLDGAAKFSARCGLLVLRGTSAAGWQARGFANNDAFKSVAVDGATGLTGRVLQSRVAESSEAKDFDANFVRTFGAPSGGTASLFPLIIKEKVAALLYADGGTEEQPEIDLSALDLLVRLTGLWVELLGLRRAAGVETAPVAARPVAVPQAPVATRLPQPAAAPVAVPIPAPAPAAVLQPVAAAVAPVAMAMEDEVHNKARRFAKLLVDEIKLYNQPKVAEGRQHRDLYDRLRDDIDKSRATYDKRYSVSVTNVDYFRQELIRILADNDVSLLGANFPQ